MSETYTPAGNVGSSLQRATAGEAATGTHGQEFMRDDMTKIAHKIRCLSDAGFPTVSKIQFPAVQVADADPNALDDYEEGVFTPVLTFGGAGVGITYAAQSGRYTKIGNRVFFNMRLALASKGSSAGSAVVGGLPFNSNAATDGFHGVAVRTQAVAAAIAAPFQAHIAPTSNVIILQKFSAGTSSQPADTDFTNTTDLIISGHYDI